MTNRFGYFKPPPAAQAGEARGGRAPQGPDWRDGLAHLVAASFDAITDRLKSNGEGGEGFDWFYASPADRGSQMRTPITDGAAGKPWVFLYKDLRGWWSSQHHNRPGGVEAARPQPGCRR